MAKIFTIWLTILPLITWNSRFEVPKVFWLLTGGIVLLFSLIINFPKIAINNRDKWYLLWLVSLLISSLFGVDFKLSLLGGSYRHQGIIFFFCLWLIIKFIELLNSKQKRYLYRNIGILVLIESILVIFGYKLGSIGEINAIAGFIVMGSYFVKVSFPKVFLILPIIGILINFSKSAVLALIPYVLKKVNILVILLIIIIAFFIKPIDNNSLVENRNVIWIQAIKIIQERPIIGYGAESNEILFDRKFKLLNTNLENLIIDRAHNLFLDITIWSGSVGLILFLGFLYYSYLNLDIDRKKVFFSFLIYSMFQPLSVAHWLLFILIL